MTECVKCGDQVWSDPAGVLIDNSGGDVCGADGTNDPHEIIRSPFEETAPTSDHTGEFVQLTRPVASITGASIDFDIAIASPSAISWKLRVIEFSGAFLLLFGSPALVYAIASGQTAIGLGGVVAQLLGWRMLIAPAECRRWIGEQARRGPRGVRRRRQDGNGPARLDSLRDILGEPVSGTPSEDTDTPARATSTLAWTAAPWTPAQVAWLTTMQTSGRVHPLTCGQCRDQLDVEGVLVPGPDGLHCKTCDYVQTSALLPRDDLSEDGDKP